MHGVRALGLQIDMQVMGLTKGDQLFPVVRHQVIHVPEHHGSRIIATGHFYLGNPVKCRHAMQQLPKRLDSLTDPGIQYHAAVNIGQKAIALLPETNQHRLPGLHITYAQPRLATIAEAIRRTHRSHPLLRFNAPKVGKMLAQGIFLEPYLGIGAHVLKTATTAKIGKLTGWLLAVRGCFQHFGCAQLIKPAAGADHFGHHGFARQGSVNKLGFAISAGNAPAIVAQGLDFTTHRLLGQNLAATLTHIEFS